MALQESVSSATGLRAASCPGCPSARAGRMDSLAPPRQPNPSTEQLCSPLSPRGDTVWTPVPVLHLRIAAPPEGRRRAGDEPPPAPHLPACVAATFCQGSPWPGELAPDTGHAGSRKARSALPPSPPARSKPGSLRWGGLTVALFMAPSFRCPVLACAEPYHGVHHGRWADQCPAKVSTC